MMHVELIALDGSKFTGKAHEVLLPTPSGMVALFENHADLVSIVSNGAVGLRLKAQDPDDFIDYYAVGSGMFSVEANHVRVLVDEAVLAEDLVEEEELQALERARLLRLESKDAISLQNAQRLIDRQVVRLNLAKLRRSSRKRQSRSS